MGCLATFFLKGISLSYQVIARKWRPKKFDELVGQNHVSQTLINALKNDRLHHALLFTGPRGTGKTSTARILAKELRCPDDPMGESEEAKDIAAGRSVDVIEIDGASNNGVDAIRELRETVGYMPSSGKFKIYIIDEVHMLSTAAFNALLKTLEEPPDHVVFIMATTEVHKIPNTILSRCQRFDFRRISLKAIADHLGEICKADGVEAAPEALWAVARQGDGSMRDSQSLLDQVITFANGDITIEKVSEILGLTDRALLMKALTAVIEKDSQTALDMIESLFQAGYDPQLFAEDLLEQIRNALIVKTNRDSAEKILDVAPSEIEALGELVLNLSAEDIHLLFDMMLKGLTDLTRANDPRIVLEMLILRMVSAPKIEPLLNYTGSTNHVPAPAPAPEKKNSSLRTDAPAPRPPAAPIHSKPYDDALTPEQNWCALVQNIKKVNGIIGAQLENTYLGKKEGQVLHIGVPGRLKFLYEKMNHEKFRNKMNNYIATYWGPGFEIDLHVDGGEQNSLTPKQALEKQRREKQVQVRAEVEAHPFLKSVSEVFKTEIKSIKEIKR